MLKGSTSQHSEAAAAGTEMDRSSDQRQQQGQRWIVPAIKGSSRDRDGSFHRSEAAAAETESARSSDRRQQQQGQSRIVPVIRGSSSRDRDGSFQ
ncbi:hypothetical protein chiPu_0011670 [Chiloscyllium punctatum]|uniref:Uncharacterized protein n=1 Tax=Chiloscyllium punctatum TaxID=137246 RepID=A0A401SS60_CHIPU|nr:hypothetical protein [Chiloscyllium punctatum]